VWVLWSRAALGLWKCADLQQPLQRRNSALECTHPVKTTG
jgi:hypothetical protein